MTGRGQLAGRARSTLRAWTRRPCRGYPLGTTIVLALLVWALAVALMTGPGW